MPGALLPAVFVSHGAPTLLLDASPWARFPGALGAVNAAPRRRPLRQCPLGDRGAGREHGQGPRDHPRLPRLPAAALRDALRGARGARAGGARRRCPGRRRPWLRRRRARPRPRRLGAAHADVPRGGRAGGLALGAAAPRSGGAPGPGPSVGSLARRGRARAGQRVRRAQPPLLPPARRRRSGLGAALRRLARRRRQRRRRRPPRRLSRAQPRTAPRRTPPTST